MLFAAPETMLRDGVDELVGEVARLTVAVDDDAFVGVACDGCDVKTRSVK